MQLTLPEIAIALGLLCFLAVVAGLLARHLWLTSKPQTRPWGESRKPRKESGELCGNVLQVLPVSPDSVWEDDSVPQLVIGDGALGLAEMPSPSTMAQAEVALSATCLVETQRMEGGLATRKPHAAHVAFEAPLIKSRGLLRSSSVTARVKHWIRSPGPQHGSWTVDPPMHAGSADDWDDDVQPFSWTPGSTTTFPASSAHSTQEVRMNSTQSTNMSEAADIVPPMFCELQYRAVPFKFGAAALPEHVYDSDDIASALAEIYTQKAELMSALADLRNLFHSGGSVKQLLSQRNKVHRMANMLLASVATQQSNHFWVPEVDTLASEVRAFVPPDCFHSASMLELLALAPDAKRLAPAVSRPARLSPLRRVFGRLLPAGPKKSPDSGDKAAVFENNLPLKVYSVNSSKPKIHAVSPSQAVEHTDLNDSHGWAKSHTDLTTEDFEPYTWVEPRTCPLNYPSHVK